MRLYAIALIVWAVTITVSSESNVTHFSDEKAVSYTEFRDLPAKQIVQPYVTGIEARSSRQTNTEDHSDDVANEELSRSTIHVDDRERGSDDASSSRSIYTTPLAETTVYPFRELNLSREREYTIEDVLLVENAGSFGQKVRQDRPSDKTIIKSSIGITDGWQGDEYASFRKPLRSTASFLENEGNHRKSYVSTTREPFVFALKKESNSADNSLSGDSETIKNLNTSTKNSDGIFDIKNTTENSLSKTNVVSTLENDVSGNLSVPQARSSRAHDGTTDKIMKKLTELNNKSENIEIVSTSVEISPSQLGKFSAPIVVPDLPDREVQDVAIIDYLSDSDATEMFKSIENAEIISKTDASKIAAASNTITTSSIMLNPLQVGITLVNAGETDLDDSEQSAATDTKDYLQDNLRLVTANEGPVENNSNQSHIDYKDGNFRRVAEEKSVGVTQKIPDNSVEIQKSIELYHTAPVHEIHYPVEYIQQTSNLGVIETNNIGNLQRLKQSYGQDDQQSELRSDYDTYQGNDQVDKSVIKAHAFTLSQKHNRHEYNALEDNADKTMASALIAEHVDIPQQTPLETLESQSFKYNDMQPILLVPNQSDDTLYDQSNAQHRYNDNGNGIRTYAKPIGSPTKPEVASELIKLYVPSTYREQQSQSNQPVDHRYQFRSSEIRRPEASQLLLKIIPEGSSADGAFLVPIPRPYPIEKIIEKTVHVPHPIEIEKVIEKQVPVAVPQPYPVHIQAPGDRAVEKQIRVPHLYPVHIERILEKRMPYTVQRLLVQPPAYLQHMRLPTVYPTEKPSSHVPIEKPVEKPAAFAQSLRQPYRTNADRPVDNSGKAKYNKYQQMSHESIFGEKANLRGNSGFAFEPQQSETNVSQFYGDFYSRPLLTYDHSKSYIPTAHFNTVKLMVLPKKFGGHVVLRPHSASAPSYGMMPAASFRRQIVYNLVEKDKTIKNEYVGPAPPRKTMQGNTAFSQVKFSPQFPVTQSSATTATLKRSRQSEAKNIGNFRQSKMEYGFKPPMIPSVQYDEKTASKVEN